MANPNPPLENLRPKPWQPGQSGNPKGYSRRRRLQDALLKHIEDSGLDGEIVRTWLAMALGDKAKLAGKEPEFQWFKLLVDTVDGKADATDDDGNPAGPHRIEDDDPRFVDQGEHPVMEGVQGPDPAD